jgi:hypothetical protein
MCSFSAGTFENSNTWNSTFGQCGVRTNRTTQTASLETTKIAQRDSFLEKEKEKHQYIEHA